MSPSEGISKELDEKFVKLIGKFVSDVRNGKVRGSTSTALAAVTLLEQIINDSQNATAFELVGTVRAAGARLGAALPHALPAANVARRLLRAIRDENRPHINQSGEASGASLQRLVLAAPARRGTLGAALDLREPIRDHIAELRQELETSASSISAQARQHVRGGSLVLACGAGALAERFLRAAAPARYQLVLAEGLHVAESHAMASRLSAAGVPVTVISNAAIYGVMSRVDKVRARHRHQQRGHLRRHVARRQGGDQREGGAGGRRGAGPGRHARRHAGRALLQRAGVGAGAAVQAVAAARERLEPHRRAGCAARLAAVLELRGGRGAHLRADVRLDAAGAHHLLHH